MGSSWYKTRIAWEILVFYAMYMATRPQGFALVLVPVYFIKHSVSCYICHAQHLCCVELALLTINVQPSCTWWRRYDMSTCTSISNNWQLTIIILTRSLYSWFSKYLCSAISLKLKHRGCWCLGGGTEAIRHEATLPKYLALLGRSSSRSLHCAKSGKWPTVKATRHEATYLSLT